MLSINSERHNRIIRIGERSLRRAVTEFVEHYHAERTLQGIDNVTIEGTGHSTGEVERHERVGGILEHYRRAA